MKFREWFMLTEDQTVSQWINQRKKDGFPLKELWKNAMYALDSIPFFQEGQPGADPKLKELFAKFFIFQYAHTQTQGTSADLTWPPEVFDKYQQFRNYVKGKEKTPPKYGFNLDRFDKKVSNAETDQDKWELFWDKMFNLKSLHIGINGLANFILNRWSEWGAFLSAKINDRQFLSKLNNADYTQYKVYNDVQNWHDEIAATRGEGEGSREYSVLMYLDDVGMKGWYWAHLYKPSCSDEARAMGHCGNVGQEKAGDNILSLRDPKNYPHLTFIINNGVLGEMKGKGNSKPSKKYFPAIIKLLQSPIVKRIEGGGYNPQGNFQFSDLDEKIQEKILKEKPGIVPDLVRNSATSGVEV